MIPDLIINIVSMMLIGMAAGYVQHPLARSLIVQVLVAAYAGWLVARTYQKASRF